MQLRINPHVKPQSKADGWLIRGASAADWLRVLGSGGIALNAVTSYAIPGTQADTIWGCLITGGPASVKGLPSASPVQLAGGCLYLPEYTELFPAVSQAELQALLKNKLYLLHPEAGLVALGEPLRWEELITLPAADPVAFTIPAAPIFIPAAIKSFEIKAAAPEDEILELEQSLTPEQKQFDDKPLNALEKTKLGIYRLLFGKGAAGGDGSGKKGALMKLLEALVGRLGLGNSKTMARLQQDFEDLERRNSSEIDKLLDLIKNNPEEALKYAIPLGDGTERGEPGAWRLSKRWGSFSLFGNGGSSRGGGGTVSISDDHQARLMQEYRRMAENLAGSGDHEKAAFIYLKLLKDYRAAAATLDAGSRYAEAAAIYLKYCNDKAAAAASYLKGNMLRAAIDIYTELGRDEEAGDLYRRLNDHAAALNCYQKVAEDYVGRAQYFKAAKLRRDKMNDGAGAQDLLLQGWRSGRDGYNCLHVYFSNIGDTHSLALAIRSIYEKHTHDGNARDFLNVLKSETERGESVAELARDIATEIVAAHAGKDAGIVSELRAFNKKNTLITKDILRYRSGRKN